MNATGLARDLFRVGRPLQPPPQFDNLDLRGMACLQPALRVRDCDRSAWVLMAWKHGFKAPHYLTPDGTLWTNGLDERQWLHESFAVFQTREQAEDVGNSIRWGKGWDYLELAQVRVSGADAYLVPVPSSDGESQEAL